VAARDVEIGDGQLRVKVGRCRGSGRPDLAERFETRKIVDRAKGLLNEKMGLSEPDAFRWIQKASMDRRLTMHDVAVAIIEQLAPKKS
jgi:response regulator NasT